MEIVCLKWQKCVSKLLSEKRTFKPFKDYSDKFKKYEITVIDHQML